MQLTLPKIREGRPQCGRGGSSGFLHACIDGDRNCRHNFFLFVFSYHAPHLANMRAEILQKDAYYEA